MAPPKTGDISASKRLSSFFSSTPSAAPNRGLDQSRPPDVVPHPPSSFPASRPYGGHSFDPQSQLPPLQPPPNLGASDYGPQTASPVRFSGSGSRPQTPVLNIPQYSSDDGSTSKLHKRRSWLPGSSKAKLKAKDEPPPKAWIAGHDGRPPYDVNLLLQGWQVPELWDEAGGRWTTF